MCTECLTLMSWKIDAGQIYSENILSTYSFMNQGDVCPLQKVYNPDVFEYLYVYIMVYLFVVTCKIFLFVFL